MKFTKSDRLRFMEFFKGVQLLKESLDKISNEKDDKYFLALSSQLRSLFILPHDKNGNPITEDVKNPIICYDLANKLNVDLTLYTEEATYEDKECQYYDHLFNTTLGKTEQNTKAISLVDWLEAEIVSIPGKKFTIREIIKIVADNNGGAHYDKNVNKEIADLCSAKNQKGVLIINLLLKKIGDVLYQVGLKIIKSLFDFQLAISLIIPRNKCTNKNIISFSYENGHSPISLSVSENDKLILCIQNQDKRRYRLNVYDLSDMDDSNILVFNMSYELNEDMQVILSVYCNDTVVQYRLGTPFFIGYNFTRNSTITLSDKDLSICFSSMKIYNQILDSDQSFKLNKTMKQINDEDSVLKISDKQFAVVDENNTIQLLGPTIYTSYHDFKKSMLDDNNVEQN